MNPTPSRLLAAFLTSFALGSWAKADIVTWTYDWTESPTVLAADHGGTGGVDLTRELPGHGSGTQSITATQIRTFSSAPDTAVDHLTNQQYNLSLHLTDDASGQTGSLSFSGLLSGLISFDAAHLTNVFNAPTSQVLTLGGHKYTITLNSFVAPGNPNAIDPGSLGALVEVGSPTPPPTGGGSGGGPPPSNAPEPSSLVLAGLGISSLGLGLLRKLRRPAT
jgi:hypothetical protein